MPGNGNEPSEAVRLRYCDRSLIPGDRLVESGIEQPPGSQIPQRRRFEVSIPRSPGMFQCFAGAYVCGIPIAPGKQEGSSVEVRLCEKLRRFRLCRKTESLFEEVAGRFEVSHHPFDTSTQD